MQWTGLNELREKYLHYFETKGHLRLGSFPLVPKDDPSLLLINSGMATIKKYYTGKFKMKDGIEQILKVLRYSSDFQYHYNMEDNEIIIL